MREAWQTQNDVTGLFAHNHSPSDHAKFLEVGPQFTQQFYTIYIYIFQMIFFLSDLGDNPAYTTLV